MRFVPFENWFYYVIAPQCVKEFAHAVKDVNVGAVRKMILGWVLVWILGGGLALGFLGFVVKEWIWKPLMLIELCKRQGITGFPFVPFVGQMPAIDEVLQGRNLSEDRLARVSSCYRKHGSTFYFTIGRTVRLSIADPALIKDILIAKADSYSKPLHIREIGILSDSVFTSSGDIWAPQRQLLNGPFHTKEIKSKIPTMIECAHLAADKWVRELQDGHGELDMYQKFAELTLDVIARSAFGTEIDGDAKSVIGGFNRYLQCCRELVFGPPAAGPGSLYGIKRRLRVRRAASKEADCLQTFMRGLIRSRRASPPSPTPRHDLLDVLLAAVDSVPPDPALPPSPDMTLGERRKRTAALTRLTEPQLLSNSLTFLLAGHETTASLLTWTTYLLATHPLWQERARAEVEEFCPGGVVEPPVLNHLKLLGMVLLEALRLFPPVPLLGRTCLKANQVGDRVVVPEGVEVVIPVAMLHRDPAIWGENAEEFCPARFADGISGACGNPLAFLPFGAGPRTCIGQTLAMSEAKAVMAVMLPRFRWRLGEGYRHSPDVTLTLMPEFGMPVVLEEREGGSRPLEAPEN